MSKTAGPFTYQCNGKVYFNYPYTNQTIRLERWGIPVLIDSDFLPKNSSPSVQCEFIKDNTKSGYFHIKLSNPFDSEFSKDTQNINLGKINIFPGPMVGFLDISLLSNQKFSIDYCFAI